jgi:hypothetical protein
MVNALLEQALPISYNSPSKVKSGLIYFTVLSKSVNNCMFCTYGLDIAS